MKRVKRICSGFMLGALILLSTSGSAPPAAEPAGPSAKTVLIVYSFHESMPWQERFREGLTSRLINYHGSLELFEEYMDSARFPTPEQANAFYLHLISKYENRKLDILITESGAASSLIYKNPELFPGAIRMYVNPQEGVLKKLNEKPGAAFIAVEEDIIGAFDAMLEVTKTKYVTVVGETITPQVRQRVDLLQARRPSGRNGVKVEYLLNMPMDFLINNIEMLPPDSAILYLLIFQDIAGKTYIPYQAAKMLASKSPAPIFSHWDSLLGSGIVGGHMLSATKVGELAGADMITLANGGEIASNASKEARVFANLYDWRALRRYKISEDSLPPGSQVLFRQSTLWSEYKYFLLGSVSFFLFLIGVISLLIYALTQRRQALRDLERERMRLEERVAVRTEDLSLSNTRLETLNYEILNKNKDLEDIGKDLQHHIEFVNQYVIILRTDQDGLTTSVSEAFCRISGYSKSELLGRPSSMLKHPEVEDAFIQNIWDAISRGEVWAGEIINKAKDGGGFWLDVNISPTYDSTGAIRGVTVIGQDITDRKMIEILSITDALTKLYNRMKLDRDLEREIERCNRYIHPISIIMFDIDHFKAVNDEHGHQTGDRVLIKIAELVKTNIRRVDIPGRWGGEEFLVICPETDEHGARTMAEKLRIAIEEHVFPDVGKITASFGAATRGPGEDPDELVNRADEALYEAKKTGRNRVVFSESPAG